MSSAESAGICVGIRMRPLLKHEKGQPACFRIEGDAISAIPDSLDPGQKEEGPWQFDHCMDSSDPSAAQFVDNAKCYDMMARNIIEHSLEGYNSCLFCYGQTGTGKTSTIMGCPETGPGILILLLEDIFKEVTAEEARGGSLTVEFQMLEVYNEEVYDLLAPKDKKSQIKFQVLPAGVTVKGAETIPIHSVDEFMKLMDRGNLNKHIAATAMNPQSSRGHTVIKLVLHKDEDVVHVSSEVYFCDLAGHESEKTTKVVGDRLRELSFINKSLMWLQSAVHTMRADAHKKGATSKNLAFRNSKLTLLMANALTGNSLVNVIVTVSPAAEFFPTSLSTLKFANEVKHLTVTATADNHVDPVARCHKLEEEVKQLKAELANAVQQAATSNGALPGTAQENLELRQQIEPQQRESVQKNESVTAKKREFDEQLQANRLELEENRSVIDQLKQEIAQLKHSERVTVDQLKQEMAVLKQREQESVPRAMVDDLHREIAGLKQREEEYLRHAQPTSPATTTNETINGNAENGVMGQEVLSPRSAMSNGSVARSLDAITAKVNELCQDLHANHLSAESTELVGLLDRARNLVPQRKDSSYAHHMAPDGSKREANGHSRSGKKKNPRSADIRDISLPFMEQGSGQCSLSSSWCQNSAAPQRVHRTRELSPYQSATASQVLVVRQPSSSRHPSPQRVRSISPTPTSISQLPLQTPRSVAKSSPTNAVRSVVAAVPGAGYANATFIGTSVAVLPGPSRAPPQSVKAYLSQRCA